MDDISIREGFCISNELLNCDFEKDLCGFTQQHNQTDLLWTRFKGKRYESESFGPSTDHTVLIKFLSMNLFSCLS